MLRKAWNDLPPSTIKNCFRKAGYNTKTEDSVTTEILEIKDDEIIQWNSVDDEIIVTPLLINDDIISAVLHDDHHNIGVAMVMMMTTTTTMMIKYSSTSMKRKIWNAYDHLQSNHDQTTLDRYQTVLRHE